MLTLPDKACVKDIFPLVRKALKSAGIDTPELDARLIILDRLNISHAEFITSPDRMLDAREKSAVEAAAIHRINRQPLSQILGRREFYGRDFIVTGDTLTPRPDSEVLIDTALGFLQGRNTAHILDLGTGTGCLLLTLLAECEGVSGVGLDISPEALAVAKKNASALGLASRCQFIEGDWFGPINEKFDLIISNPPYIETSSIGRLHDEVRLFEPHLALDGGGDGLASYRLIIPTAKQYLHKDGNLVLEIGSGQKEHVFSIFSQYIEESTVSGIGCKQDLAGHDRCVFATY